MIPGTVVMGKLHGTEEMDMSSWFYIGQKWEFGSGDIYEVLGVSSRYKRHLILRDVDSGSRLDYSICKLLQAAREVNKDD